MTHDHITPLQPREFFRGVWTGEGELVPLRWFRWFAPAERFRYSSEAVWLSDTVWTVKDHFSFDSGRVIEREMYSKIIAPDRLHVTADDMPGGADMILHETSFRFTPYQILSTYRGIRWRLKCTDECTIDDAGAIHDEITMRLCGFPVARMHITVRRSPL